MAKKKTPAQPPAGTFGTPGRKPSGPSPDRAEEQLDLVRQRHPEWKEHQIAWRFLQDSYEGGGRYRNAIYGLDRRGQPVRNMIRHKREYPPPREGAANQMAFSAMMPGANPLMAAYGLGTFPGAVGSDPAALATDDPYEYRRARTPIPRFVGHAVNMHLGKIFGRKVVRKGPASLEEWWKDVDGCGTTIDDWIRDIVGPLLLVCGSLDILCDHPENETGEEVLTVANQKSLGLDCCCASYILPDNMLAWKLDCRKRYVWCLVREFNENDSGGVDEVFRRWTATESTLYDKDGQIISSLAHGYGRVPIVRLMGVPKTRCRNIGQPEYEEIAEIQREFYNRDSELVLSDSMQAHPLLQGPSDYCKADSEVTIGPDYLLPKFKTDSGTSVHYEGFEFIEPPKGAAESLRANKDDLRDAADRSACMAKPAGAEGAGTVSQSGISKQLDFSTGNDLLRRRAGQLGRAERKLCEFVLLCQNDRPATPAELDAVDVNYPQEFDLWEPEDLAKVITEYQAVLSAAGDTPDTECALIGRLLRLILPGLSDDEYTDMDDEIELFIEDAAERKAQAAEMAPMMPPGQPGMMPPADPDAPDEPAEAAKPEPAEPGEPIVKPKPKKPAGPKIKKPVPK